MPPKRSLKIDLHNEYPCPCRRRGRLQPIVLTEAMGCDRCQQIFVLQENGQVIEQLSSSYPYKRMWRWNGYRWVAVHQSLRENYLSIVLGIFLLLIFMGIPFILRSPTRISMIVWIGIVTFILLFLLFWLAYRR